MAAQAGTIATAYVQVLPSTKGIGSNLTKQMQGPSTEAGKSAGKSLGSAIKGAIAKIGITAAVVKTFKDTISEGAKLQQSYLGGLDTIYKESANSMRGYADAAAAYGMSANDYAEQAVGFGAALKQAFGGDTQKAAESANTAIMDMADNAAKMGTDVGSLQYAYQGFAKQNYTMLDNLKLGYGGTKDEMERLLADAQKITGVKYDISNLGDVYEAIHVIQGQLGITGVAADEAKTTVSGSFDAMKASAKDLIGHLALGDDIKPQLVTFGKSVITYLQNLIPMIGNILKTVGETAASAVKTGIKNLPGLMSKAANKLNGLADLISGVTGPQIDQVFSDVQGKVGSWISGTFVPFMQQSFLPALQKLGSAIYNAIGAFFVNILPQLLSMATNGIKSLISQLSGVTSGDVNTAVTSGLSSIISTAGPWITGTFFPYVKNTLLPLLGKLGLAILQLLGQLGLMLLEAIGSLLSNIWNALTAQFPVLQTIVDTIKNIVLTTVSIIKLIIMGIVATITTIVNFVITAWGTIKSAVTTAAAVVMNVVVTAWNGIRSVTTTVWTAISTVTSIVWNGIKSVVTTVWNAIKSVAVPVANAVKSGVSDAWTAIKTVTSTVWNGIKTATSTVWNGVKTTITTVVGVLKSTVTAAWNGIRSVTTTVWNGIRSAVIPVANAVRTGVSSAWNGIRSVTGTVWNGIKSTVSGVINGIKSTISGGLNGALGTVSSVLGSIRSKFSSIFDGCRSIVTGAISKIKGAFNFSWHLPKLALPHIHVSGGVAPFGIAGKGSLPHFSVEWYAKGGILKKPTIFGMNGESLMGGGEAGPEAVLPIDNLRGYIMDAMEEQQSVGNYTQNIYITSPTALTPSEVARQTRNATRQMALNMIGA